MRIVRPLSANFANKGALPLIVSVATPFFSSYADELRSLSFKLSYSVKATTGSRVND